jgi:hypothetical protein
MPLDSIFSPWNEDKPQTPLEVARRGRSIPWEDKRVRYGNSTLTGYHNGEVDVSAEEQLKIYEDYELLLRAEKIDEALQLEVRKGYPYQWLNSVAYELKKDLQLRVHKKRLTKSQSQVLKGQNV